MHASKKSLCEIAGHNWRVTTALNYRVCQSSGCRAAQCFTHGQWVNVPQRARAQEQDCFSQQLGLFGSGAPTHG